MVGNQRIEIVVGGVRRCVEAACTSAEDEPTTKQNVKVSLGGGGHIQQHPGFSLWIEVQLSAQLSLSPVLSLVMWAFFWSLLFLICKVRLTIPPHREVTRIHCKH